MCNNRWSPWLLIVVEFSQLLDLLVAEVDELVDFELRLVHIDPGIEIFACGQGQWMLENVGYIWCHWSCNHTESIGRVLNDLVFYWFLSVRVHKIFGGTVEHGHFRKFSYTKESRCKDNAWLVFDTMQFNTFSFAICVDNVFCLLVLLDTSDVWRKKKKNINSFNTQNGRDKKFLLFLLLISFKHQP